MRTRAVIAPGAIAALVLGTLTVGVHVAGASGWTRGAPSSAAPPARQWTAAGEHPLTGGRWRTESLLPRQTGPLHPMFPMNSLNWAGQIDTGNGFNDVGAHWNVPGVTPSSGDASSTWIGIDGVTDLSLLQTGTAQESGPQGSTYFAWYEVIPAPAIEIGGVLPGDQMVASIVENRPGSWTVAIADVTSGQSVSIPVDYGGPATSAEWIEEAPVVNGVQATLANFGTAGFSDMTVDGAAPSAAALTLVRMYPEPNVIAAWPSDFDAATDSFNVSWGNPNTGGFDGYWLVGGDGGIFNFGFAQFFGSTGDLPLQRPVVGITPTWNRLGYWLVATDGGLFSFGNAPYLGSIPGLGIAPAGTSGPGRHLSAPVVGMVPSIDGDGYFMVGADGGVFAFGDAVYRGSCPAIGGCDGPAVAVMPDATGLGYWLVTSTGSVYAFGDATYLGSPGPAAGIPVTSAVRTHDGEGYWVLYANGAVASYGDAMAQGSLVGGTGPTDPASAIVGTTSGSYWIVTVQGSVYPFGYAPNQGAMAGQPLNAPIVAAAGF